MPAPLIHFYDHSFASLLALWRQNDLTPASAGLVYNWHYKHQGREVCDHHNLPRRTREFLREGIEYALPQPREIREANDRTVKFVFGLKHGASVETVLIPFLGKYTVCLSSQVGCAMACAFCRTGEQGFTRQLQTHEIVGQLLGVKDWLKANRPGDDRILNLVFMGQGEPLHNLIAVAHAAKIFVDQRGLSFAGHKITVSTAGYLPGLKRWSLEMPDVNVALSLHAVDEGKRNQLIPIGRRYPLAEILPLVDQIPQGRKRFATYEVLLARNFNDAAEDARAVAELLRGKKALINLIPFNEYPGARFRRPSDQSTREFKAVLDEAGLPTTIRRTKGDAILAACGQLQSAENCSTAAPNSTKRLISKHV